MIKIDLPVYINKDDWTVFIEKYHFREENIADLKTVYIKIKEKLNSVAFIDMTSEVKKNIPYENYCICVVTLGESVDRIQDEYSNNEEYSEAFMVECIGMELLKRAYELLGHVIAETYRWWLKKYEFYGDSFPIEDMKEIVEQIPDGEVSCNQIYLLQPKKSVVFIAEMVREKTQIHCNICDGCGNTSCPTRTK